MPVAGSWSFVSSCSPSAPRENPHAHGPQTGQLKASFDTQSAVHMAGSSTMLCLLLYCKDRFFTLGEICEKNVFVQILRDLNDKEVTTSTR